MFLFQQPSHYHIIVPGYSCMVKFFRQCVPPVAYTLTKAEVIAQQETLIQHYFIELSPLFLFWRSLQENVVLVDGTG